MNGTAEWLVDGGPWIYALLVVGFPVTAIGVVGFIGGLMLKDRRAARWLAGVALLLTVIVLGIGWEAGRVQLVRGHAAMSHALPSDRETVQADADANAQVPRNLAVLLALMPFGAAVMLGVRGFIGWGGGARSSKPEAVEDAE